MVPAIAASRCSPTTGKGESRCLVPQSKTLSQLKGSGAGMSVLVLGAGVGGLTTAFQLLNDAAFDSVTVLEARDRIGGRCTTLSTSLRRQLC
jgi:heterodisulfide reductase subunit A-like polyferredoxin